MCGDINSQPGPFQPAKGVSKKIGNSKQQIILQGYALAKPSGPWHLTFALGQLENLSFFIQILCWAPNFTGSKHWVPFNFS